MEPRDGLTRHSQVRAIRLLGALTVAACLAACGHHDGRPTPAAGSTREPTDLTCPGGDAVGTDGGYLAELPDGFDTREEAVESWLSQNHDFTGPYVISADGRGAWLVREDGTAKARLEFLRHSGFTVHGYERCTS